MDVLRSLALAFSCFSIVPMPRVEWNERNLRFMLACFPAVGIVSGAALLAWWALADAAGLGGVMRAVGVVLVPLTISGGIHLDGFADTIDALSSHADVARKREILQDPHVGAFAVMGIGALLLLYFGLISELPSSWTCAVLLACVQVLVRCESGFASIALSGQGAGMLASLRGAAEARASFAALVAEYALVLSAACLLATPWALAVAACGMACLALLPSFARRNFGGMSGDVAGFFLVVCELVMVASLVVVAKAVGL